MTKPTTWDLRKRLIALQPWLASPRVNPEYTVDELGQPRVVISGTEYMLDTVLLDGIPRAQRHG